MKQLMDSSRSTRFFAVLAPDSLRQQSFETATIGHHGLDGRSGGDFQNRGRCRNRR